VTTTSSIKSALSPYAKSADVITNVTTNALSAISFIVFIDAPPLRISVKRIYYDLWVHCPAGLSGWISGFYGGYYGGGFLRWIVRYQGMWGLKGGAWGGRGCFVG
jgi:hypothetical protein